MHAPVHPLPRVKHPEVPETIIADNGFVPGSEQIYLCFPELGQNLLHHHGLEPPVHLAGDHCLNLGWFPCSPDPRYGEPSGASTLSPTITHSLPESTGQWTRLCRVFFTAVTPTVEKWRIKQWANLDNWQQFQGLIYVGAFTYSSKLVLMVACIHANFSGHIAWRRALSIESSRGTV